MNEIKLLSDRTALLRHVLGQNQLVHDRVEQAGAELSSVNDDLKQELDHGPNAALKGALSHSEAIEAEIQGAAEELVAVNHALGEEVAERHSLEQQLTESRASEREALHDALHDKVTGLPNLALFNDRLRNAMAQAERHKWRLAVMFIDLDNFKVINDTHGHDVGDLVLSTVAERLNSQVRSGDTVCRRSGDEFLLLMLEAKDSDNAALFAEKLIERLADPWQNDQVRLSVRASVGISMYPEDGQTAPLLLKCADLAMYAAKRQKKGWELFSRLPRV
jgi:diguanylate cyclase